MTDAQRDQLDAVLLICAEVERHCNAIDPADPTAASVLVELNLDLVSGLRILCKVVREDLQTHAPIACRRVHVNEMVESPHMAVIRRRWEVLAATFANLTDDPIPERYSIGAEFGLINSQQRTDEFASCVISMLGAFPFAAEKVRP